jgi:hypothetical protein
VGWLAPVVVPIVHNALCGDKPDCSYVEPIKIELPKKDK